MKELPEDVSSMTPDMLAADWNMKYQVSDTWSAYSTMLQDKNKDIIFYYEENQTGSTFVYDMIYCKISVEDITSGLYRAIKR